VGSRKAIRIEQAPYADARKNGRYIKGKCSKDLARRKPAADRL